MPPSTDSRTRAARALDRILNKPVSALLGWQKSDTEIVISAPGGLGRVYITWPESGTRDTAVNRRGVPLARRLPILVVPGAPNVIVDIDSSDMTAVAAVFNGDYGTPPHAASHKHGGTDEIATATPAANAIPKADGSGTLNDWVTGVDDVATQIAAAATDDTIVDTDIFGYLTGGVLVKSAWSNLKAVLKTHFDTLYNLYVHPNHTGEVTSSGDGATTIANDAVTTAKIANDAVNNAKAANMAQATIKGRASGAGTGDPTDLTATQARTILNVADNADNTATAINGAADLGAPADTDKLAAVRGGSLGTILISALKTALNALYGRLASTNTWTAVNTYSSRVDAPIVRADSAAGLRLEDDAGSLGVFIEDGGNHVGINTATPGDVISGGFAYGATGHLLHIDGQNARFIATGSTSAGFDFVDTGATTDRKWFQMVNDGGILKFRSLTDAAANQADNILVLDHATGRVSIGTASPHGPLHVHDGTGGSMFVTKTGVNGTAQTILDGANDVLRRCVITYVLWATDNTMSAGSTISIANNTSFQVFVDAGSANGVTFAVASNGTLTIQRTTGTKTFNFAGHIVWL